MQFIQAGYKHCSILSTRGRIVATIDVNFSSRFHYRLIGDCPASLPCKITPFLVYEHLPFLMFRTDCDITFGIFGEVIHGDSHTQALHWNYFSIDFADAKLIKIGPLPGIQEPSLICL